MLEGSFILVKGWNIVPLNLLSSQHLSSQTEPKTFGSNNVWEENKDGLRRLISHRRGKKKKVRNTGKAWKSEIPPPFPLGEGGGFQGSETVKCYFSSISFEPRGNLKSRSYSSLVTIPFQNVFWNDFLKGFHPPSPQRLHSHTSWDSLHCAAWIPAYLHRWNWKGIFFSSVLPHFLPKYILRYILEWTVAISDLLSC